MKKLDIDASSRDLISNLARAWLNASTKSGLVIAAGTRDGTNLYKRATEKVSKGSAVCFDFARDVKFRPMNAASLEPEA